jgi:hypothetical protein
VEVSAYEGTLAAWVRFEVYADEGGTDLLLSEIESLENTDILGLSLAAVELSEDTRYFWRARSETELSTTDWSEMRSFVVNALNTPPPTPMLLSPEDDSTLGERSPTFTARTVVDSDGDTLKYLFRFYRQNGEIETLGYGLVEDNLATFSQPQREGVTLLWEVVAIDEVGAQSAPTPQWQFLIDALNKAPTAPEINRPEVDSILTSNPLDILIGGSEDPDGHSFSYGVSVYADDLEPILVGTAEPDTEGDARFVAEETLEEDRGYDLIVFAEDEFGARSDSTIHRFFLSSENDPPTTPAPIEPVNLSPLVSSQAVLIWSLATDPEGAAVTYRLTICTQMFDVVDLDDCFVQERLQSNGFDFRADAQDGQTYYWSVEALDETGLASAPSEVWSFRVLDGDDQTGDGCECDQSRRSPLSLWVLFFGILIGCRRRLTSS